MIAKLKVIKVKLRKRMHLPRPTILHPWPSQRFYANTRGRSPVR